jgi:hypothetical protein
MSKGRKKAGDVVTMPLKERGVPTRSELEDVWLRYKHLQASEFIEAARLPPMTKDEYLELKLELMWVTAQHKAVDVINIGRERKLGGTDKIAAALEEMGCSRLFSAHKKADQIRRLVAEENEADA